MKFFKDKDEAIAAGEDEAGLVELHWRTPAERDAIQLAAQFGNRKQRRDRKYRPHLLPKQETGATVPDIGPAERRRRAAARVADKKQRKRNA